MWLVQWWRQINISVPIRHAHVPSYPRNFRSRHLCNMADFFFREFHSQSVNHPSTMKCFLIEDTPDILNRSQLMDFRKLLLAMYKVYPDLFQISRTLVWLSGIFRCRQRHCNLFRGDAVFV